MQSWYRLDLRGCVKVGDFGLAEDMYGRGYVREDSKTVKIPYKWMPPESLEDALFSEKSDVVRHKHLSLTLSLYSIALLGIASIFSHSLTHTTAYVCVHTNSGRME